MGIAEESPALLGGDPHRARESHSKGLGSPEASWGAFGVSQALRRALRAAQEALDPIAQAGYASLHGQVKPYSGFSFLSETGGRSHRPPSPFRRP